MNRHQHACDTGDTGNEGSALRRSTFQETVYPNAPVLRRGPKSSLLCEHDDVSEIFASV
jgi:hypothetical protein